MVKEERCPKCRSVMEDLGMHKEYHLYCPKCCTRSVEDNEEEEPSVLLSLDPYDEMLSVSGDPADKAAFLIRQAMKTMGVDPDEDEWWIVRQSWAVPPDSEINVRECYCRPLVVSTSGDDFVAMDSAGEMRPIGELKIKFDDNDRSIVRDIAGFFDSETASFDILPRLSDPRLYFTSILTSFSDRGTIKMIEPTEYALANLDKLKGKTVAIDGDLWLVKDIDPPWVKNSIGLVVKQVD